MYYKTIFTFVAGVMLFACSFTEKEGEINKSAKQVQSEDFKVFLVDFAKDSTFQVSRVIFPFKDCYIEITGDSSCSEITKSEWIYLELIKDNFTDIKETQDQSNKFESEEKILSIESIINNTGANYYFKKQEGRWYLKKRVVYL